MADSKPIMRSAATTAVAREIPVAVTGPRFRGNAALDLLCLITRYVAPMIAAAITRISGRYERMRSAMDRLFCG